MSDRQNQGTQSLGQVEIPDTRLRIEPRREKDPPARVESGKVVLEGELPWLLRGPADAIADAERALAGFAERLDQELLAVRFGNAVGRFRWGDARSGGATFEVVSGKWTAADFDAMLADLAAKVAGLPFKAGVSGALPYERGAAAREQILYHAFVYLRHATLAIADRASNRLDPLPQALTAVLAAPHRRWDREGFRVATDRATRIDESTLLEAVAGRRPLYRAPPTLAARIPLARALRGLLPQDLVESRLRVSVDTPENRFVKAFLALAADMTERLRTALTERPGSATPFSRRLADDTRKVDRALGPFRRHALWNEVGRMVHFPVASTTLQRRRGYRQIFSHFARLQLITRLPVDAAQIDDLLELKDIAQLYEIWTFFVLADELSRFLGTPETALTHRVGRFDVKVPENHAAVTWPNGTVLEYNPRFSRSQPGGRNSYSVPLRPDLGLRIASGSNQGLHLLDAKFRLKRVGEWARGESEHLAAEERRGDFKRGDLYKMHTYRDAIPDARSVWILYPGTEICFFGCDGSVCQDPRELPAACAGVGAVPLRPGDKRHSSLQQVLATLLRRPLQGFDDLAQ